MRPVVPLLALLAAACVGDTLDTQRVRLSLGSDGAGEPLPGDEADAHTVYAFSGEVTAVGSASADSFDIVGFGDHDHALAILDGDGESWQIGYALADRDDADATPAVGIEVGEQVDVQFLSSRGWASDSAVVVLRDGVPVVAAREGYEAQPLDDAHALGGLGIEVGADYGPAYHNDCGAYRASYARVTDDNGSTDLENLSDFDASVGGTAVNVRNVATWHYDGEIRCTDTWGPHAWFVWQ